MPPVSAAAVRPVYGQSSQADCDENTQTWFRYTVDTRAAQRYSRDADVLNRRVRIDCE